MLIRVRRNAVESHDARAPGYRAAVEAMATTADDTHYTVPRSKYQRPWRQYLSHRPAVATRRRKPVAIGDLVELVLTAVGITKDRVQAWTRTKDCGCKARQRWLNQWGYRKQEQFARAINVIGRWSGFG